MLKGGRTDLADLQARFQAAVVQHADPGALLRGNPRGLAAYRHAYGARLAEALQDNYAALHQALGDDAFAGLAAAYAAAHPPTEPSIRRFGHALPDFMDAWPSLPHPALADLARLDWALRHAFDAEALPPLPAERLHDPAQWAVTPLRLQPHVRLLTLRWAVAPAWHALQAAREAGQEAELAPPEASAHAMLTWRRGERPQWRSLETAEAEALAAVRGQSAAAWLADLAAAGHPDLPQGVAWLQAWVADGLVSG